MKALSSLFQTEKKHFDRLSSYGKHLISSFFLYSLASPIYSIFIYAFLWRESQDVMMLALYNLTTFVGLPLGFLANWYFLKRIYPPQMYFIGAFAQIITISLLIFIGHVTPVTVVLYGLFYGISAGLYWANRNTLTLRIVSKSENRMYFSSLDSTASALSGIIIPILIGLIIVFGETHNLYPPLHGYYLVTFLGIIAIYFTGRRVQRIQLKLPDISHIILRHPTKHWNKVRLMIFINGLFGGVVTFIPIFLALHFIGKEDALGTVQSLSAITAAIIAYTIAKRVTTRQRLFVYSAGVGLAILASMSFALSFSTTGVFLFFIFQALALPLINISYVSFFFDAIDEENREKNSHYAYILDSEIFVNLGRICSVYIFIFLVLTLNEQFALRYTLLIFSIIQIAFIFMAYFLGKSGHKYIIDQYTKGEIIP